MVPSTRRAVVVACALILVVAVAAPAFGQVKKSAADNAARSGQVVASFMTGGQVWSSAVHDAGTVFIGSDDGSLWALEMETLKPKWRFDTGGRVRSIPAVKNGSVYFSSDDGFLYCVAAKDGARSWRFDLESAGIERVLPSLQPPYSYDYLSSSPTLHGGILLVGSANGVLYAVDAATGEEKWRFATKGRIRSTATVHQGLVYIGSWDHHLYALDIADGKLAWKFDTGGVVQASPTIGGGKVFVGSRNPKVFALDAATGKQVWEYEHSDGSWVESSGVYKEGTLYLGSSDARKLFAYDGASGEVRWTYTTGGWSWSTPSISDESVFIGAIGAYPYYFEGVTLEGGLHAVSLETGTARWMVPTGKLPGYVTGGVMSTPLSVAGRVIFGALDNRVIAVAE